MAIWLRSNTRALSLGMIIPAIALLGGLALLLTENPAARAGGGLLAAIGATLVLLLAWQIRLPRLAFDRGHLLVYLQGSQPIRVPIEIVECFLLGQVSTMLPGKRHEHAETASVVIRLSESSPEWSHRDVKPALGKWCEGYITIRGTWCEPLSVPLINRLNAQLAEAVQAQRQAKVAS